MTKGRHPTKRAPLFAKVETLETAHLQVDSAGQRAFGRLGALVKRVRTEVLFETAKQFAERVGCAKRIVAKLESGDGSVSILIWYRAVTVIDAANALDQAESKLLEMATRLPGSSLTRSAAAKIA